MVGSQQIDLPREVRRSLAPATTTSSGRHPCCSITS